MRWVLARPFHRSPYYDPEIQEPLGIEYLAACLRARGDSVLLLDGVLDGAGDTRLGRRAAAFHPDAVGLSIMTADDLPSALAIATSCREALGPRAVRWLAGGNFVSTELGHALRLLPDDMHLVRFAGESAVTDLAARWESEGADPIDPPDDRVHIGLSVEDLDSLPFPERPFAPEIVARRGGLNVLGSRGCCGSCTYCASPGMAAQAPNPWRGRSAANIAEEIEWLVRAFRARSFCFVDEDFLGPPALAEARAKGLADELARRGLNVAFAVQVRPVSLTDEIIDVLVAAGLTYVFLGVESIDPEDFRRWRRPPNPDPWRPISRLHRHGVGVNAGTLMFHSHSTLAGIRRFALGLHAHRLLNFRVAVNRLGAMPGSQLHREAAERGELDPTVLGPQPLPGMDPSVEHFRAQVVEAIAPLGPPSMHAACCVPDVLARNRFEPDMTPTRERLDAILASVDGAVADSLFALLDRAEAGGALEDLTAELRQTNLAIAIEAIRDLAECGLAASAESLREAVRKDSGL